MELEERQPLLRPPPSPGARRGSPLHQFVATFVVDIMALVFGMGMGWSATALPLLLSADTPLRTGPISLDDASWIASVLCIMAMVTTPGYHYVCERFGRKICGYCTVAPGLVSAALLIASDSAFMLYLARALVGACYAGTFIVCPIYVTEIAEDGVRGSLGVVIMLMRNIGIFLSYIIGAYFSFRTVTWICFGPPVVFLLGFLWLPETPVFLLRQGKDEEATRAMRWLRGEDSDPEGQIERLKASLAAMQSQGHAPGTIREMMADKTAMYALLISFVLFCNQQLCGFYGIISYTVMIFQESGSDWSPNTCSIIVGFMLVCGTLLSVFLCDYTGRKFLMTMSDILMAVTLVVLGAYFYCKSNEFDVSLFHWVPVTCLSIYVTVLNAGLSSLPVLIATELFSPKFTSLAMTITAPSTWFLTFIVAKYFPLMSEVIGLHGTCLVYAAICAAGTFFIIKFLPETKNRSLASILEELEEKRSVLSCCGKNHVSHPEPIQQKTVHRSDLTDKLKDLNM